MTVIPHLSQTIYWSKCTLEFSLCLIEILFPPAIKGPHFFLHFLYSETGGQSISFFNVVTKNIQKTLLCRTGKENGKEYLKIRFLVLGPFVVFQTVTQRSLFHGIFLPVIF